MKTHSIFYIVLLSLAVVGCAGTGTMPEMRELADADREIVSLLYEQYDSWQGVRYRDGGLSRNGVDCSGYVHLTYRDKFGRALPRSTELLAKSGTEISPRQMRPGDLVFFKTGRKKNHVGIYLDGGSFMHASSSRGVMISKLRERYWSDRFWMARRVK